MRNEREWVRVADESAASTAKVYFNGVHVATITTGLGFMHDGNPDFDAPRPYPTLGVVTLFHSVTVDEE